MSAKTILGSLVVAWAASAASAVNAAPCTAAVAWWGAAMVGQAAPGDAPGIDKSAQAADLLRRARQAMAENDLNAAAALIGQAESLKVQYGPLHFGDTPQKARQDLERRRAAAGAVRPSQLFNPQAMPNRPGEAGDPFLSHGIDPARGAAAGQAPGSPAANGDMTRLPPVDPSAGVPHLRPDNPVSTGLTPFGRVPGNDGPPAQREDQLPSVLARTYGMGQTPENTQPGMLATGAPQAGLQMLPPAAGNAMPMPNAAVAASNQALLAARRSLAVGDVQRAAAFLEQAKAMPAQRGMYDDTPENVEVLVRKYRDLASVPGDRRNNDFYRREYARLELEQAEGLVRRGDLDTAEGLAQHAAQSQVVFGPTDSKPENLLQRIAATRRQNAAGMMAGAPNGMPGANFHADPAVVPAGGQMAVGLSGAPADQRASQAVYDAAHDPTRNVQASSVQPAGLQAPPPPSPEAINAPPALNAAANGGMATPAGNSGMALFQQGEAALRAHDGERALQLFRQAYAFKDQLDPVTQRQLQDHLQLLSAPRTTPTRPGTPTITDEAAARQQLLARQIEADILQEESNAKATVAKDPKKALEMLQQTRKKVESAGLDNNTRDLLLRRIDRSMADMRHFIDENRPRIELQANNERIRDEVDHDRRAKAEMRQKLKEKIDQYNKLVEEQRFEEAEVVAKQAMELDPNDPVANQVALMARMTRRYNKSMQTRDSKENGFQIAMENVETSDIPFDDNKPMVFGDAKQWKALSARRAKALAALRDHGQSERDLEIHQKLKMPVSFSFEDQPLSKVVEEIGQIAGINVFLDPQGLADEGVTSDQKVTLKLKNEITLKSALNIILQPLKLNYIVKDEVLKITSEQQRNGQLLVRTYNVADLVIPIPNFAPNARMGLPGAIHTAMNDVGFGGNTGFAAPMSVVATPDGSKASGMINPAVLGQLSRNGTQTGQQQNLGGGGAGGPGGANGGSGADFDSLIELITTTVKPQTWDAVGGPGSIAGFETNLSLVVSQTQDVHEEIVDLLEQLRRLQDLQVTIEVRFITLSDSFYERIGVDFDFELPSNLDRPYQVFGNVQPGSQSQFTSPTGFAALGGTSSMQGPNRNVMNGTNFNGQNATVGLAAPGLFAADMDIPFRQGSYSLATPSFGGLPGADPYGGASMGFAILSDIEAFFFITAAQGDNRTNVLQAPKVTLFNGQQAFVSDTSQSPFVISVIPVVGDFAAAQQPVIVVLNEGTFLTVQAVVSPDRRFVRLTVVPFFSKIGAVNNFTFTGSQTTTTNTSQEGVQTAPNDNSKNSTSSTTAATGTTVQLPTFSFVTVTTTVSVPDGGTVLLGGIKRLSEQRLEYGVPILSKIPYIDRLFRNTGIGRDTSSLMMMVTPRIIIQEEEEERLGVTP